MADIIQYHANIKEPLFDEIVSQIGEEKFIEIACIKPASNYSLAVSRKNSTVCFLNT